MGEIAVVVVGAETPGNVGTIARAMKNFGFADMLLVDPPHLKPDGEAYGFAGHAREDVLPGATETTFEAVVENYYTVGFTAITNESGANHVRYPFLTPAELADDLAGIDADAALVFGREDTGLSNDELARLDRVCSIPASAEYPVLNLGQAATVALYELRDLPDAESQLPDITDRADPGAIEAVIDQFESLLADIGYREVKRAKTARLWRRVVGRAHPTEREVTTLRGVLRRAGQQARGSNDGDGSDGSGPDDAE
ncbi:MAG: RNA methyltransferase [Halobacteriales archaeon]